MAVNIWVEVEAIHERNALQRFKIRVSTEQRNFVRDHWWGYGLREVAKYFGRDPATLETLLGRLAARIDQEAEVRRNVERLSKIVETPNPTPLAGIPPHTIESPVKGKLQ